LSAFGRGELVGSRESIVYSQGTLEHMTFNNLDGVLATREQAAPY
jgi:hypothetical protein